ncbi:uncharacterized protein LOC110601019 isoform X2 [Manihot esculenta]|uniref:uncharacterized protein LOC110601019 isoform X2 n=1 Tax=Manihot esculenta TaxID=3983 RepID=UPI001CC4CF44|nr:uncharacterized protein LOC110601019 isoform X2 [Manihot esculenta]
MATFYWLVPAVGMAVSFLPPCKTMRRLLGNRKNTYICRFSIRNAKKGMAITSKQFLVFLFLCLANSIQFSAVSSSTSPQGYQEHAVVRTLKQEQGNAHEVHCSRERSRAAWKIIEEYLMPFVEKEQYQIPIRCRLHPANDLYRDQEEHKLQEDINEWRCGYCKKEFYDEKYLDKHLDNRHFDLLNVSLAQSCFPVNEGPSAHRLNEFFLRQFCDAHTCTGHQKPFSKGGKKQTSILYIILSVLILMLLLLFYCFVYLYRRGTKRGAQGLKRISKSGHQKKSS